MGDNSWMWVLAVLLVFAGLAGTVLPALARRAARLCGLAARGLGRWFRPCRAADADRCSACSRRLSFAIDFAAAALGAKRVGATKYAIIGAALGTLTGIFFGLPGLLIGPFAGAVTGELRLARSLAAGGACRHGDVGGTSVRHAREDRARLYDDRHLRSRVVPVKRLVSFVLSAVGSAAFGLAIIGGVLYAHFLRSGPELEVWHRAPLEQEFTAARADDVRTLADYFALEQRLFAELDREVYAHVEREDQVPYIRYARGSRSDPHRWSHDWNRSFELGPAEGAVGAALLLHGLTDSPYSMRSIGEHLAARGYHVVGLRLPGHGTAPSGLLNFTVEDMRAAVDLAVRDLQGRLSPGQPFLIVGYSNGAALAVDYALRQRADPAHWRRPDGLVLISPAIGISRFAAIGTHAHGTVVRAGVRARGLAGHRAWSSIRTSTARSVSTQRVRSSGSRVVCPAKSRSSRSRALLRDFPPVLAFISTVDSTVHVDAVVDALLEHLEPNGHELVLFDINRNASIQPLLVKDPGPLTGRLLAMKTRSFALTVITNVDPHSMQVEEMRSAVGGRAPTERPLGLQWPAGVSSLSHVSLPFPPDDPLYGYEPVGEDGIVRLGRVEVRGENGLLAVPPWVLMRQRSNPFHSYLTERIDEFIERAQRSSDPAAGSPASPAAAPAPAGTRPST